MGNNQYFNVSDNRNTKNNSSENRHEINPAEAFTFSNDQFEIGTKKTGDSYEVCFLNWSDKSRIYTKPINGRYEVYDKWTQESLGVHDKIIKQKLPPHSGAVLVLHEAGSSD